MLTATMTVLWGDWGGGGRGGWGTGLGWGRGSGPPGCALWGLNPRARTLGLEPSGSNPRRAPAGWGSWDATRRFRQSRALLSSGSIKVKLSKKVLAHVCCETPKHMRRDARAPQHVASPSCDARTYWDARGCLATPAVLGRTPPVLRCMRLGMHRSHLRTVLTLILTADSDL